MSLVVQKFGGSSVADPDRMRRCAQRAITAKRAGHDVIVVVSAMGDSTDDLLSLADRISSSPAKRELDQLLATGEQVSIALMAMTLNELGFPAISLTGAQAGIRTEPAHSRARIRSVDRDRLDRELAAGRIPVVAGFQGTTDDGEITTLGRGGSDTTAVALAAALNAHECEIYTDVDGVYTADPRLVPNAILKQKISYDEMMEAASLGAKVMHLRAVELGKNYSVPIRVLHSGRVGPGTLICPESECMESRSVSSVVLKKDIGRVTMTRLPNRPGIQSELFRPIAAAGISVDDIIQTETATPTAGEPLSGEVEIALTVDRADLSDVNTLLKMAAAELGSPEPTIDLSLCKVSAVGVGMRSNSGVASTMFDALAQARIRIANITTSEIRISCLLPHDDGERALRTVHDAFGLGDAGGSVSVASGLDPARRQV
ncbi:MAG: aspartate kinase [Phycisphaeraceae bacterium]|nr:aspartate kinase [Phycisphaeraceae bacterium]